MLYGYKELQDFLKKLGLNPTSAGNLQRALRRKWNDEDSIHSYWYAIGVENPIVFPVSEECIISHIKEINDGNYRRYNLGKKGLEEVQQIQKKLDIPLDIQSEISEAIIDEFTEVFYDVDERNLFVTIRALCWFSSSAEMPSDKQILDFIKDAKERYGKLL